MMCENITLHVTQQLSSGVEAGVMLVLLFNPVWVVKTRLALQGAESTGHAKYNGSIGTTHSSFSVHRTVAHAMLLTCRNFICID